MVNPRRKGKKISGAAVTRGFGQRPSQSETQTIGIPLQSLRDCGIDPDVRENIQRRQDERIAAAMRGDRAGLEYAEAQLRYLLTKCDLPLKKRLGPDSRLREVAVVTDPLQGVILVCKCWSINRSATPLPPTARLL